MRDNQRPHRWPQGAPSEVLAWECAACGEWIDDSAKVYTPCPVDWRAVALDTDGTPDAT